MSAVLFAWHLRDNVGIKDALPWAIDHAIPAFLSERSITQGLRISPSASVVRHAQLGLDMAWMLVRRRAALDKNSARYGWADSSLVAKSDWLISKTQAISSESCGDAAEAFRELVRTRPDQAGAGAHVDPARRQTLSNLLFEAVRIHTHVPQNLALGMTGLEQKVAALTFGFYLELGSLADLLAWLDTFVSFTTDMGTELGTASFFFHDVWRLFPAWLRNAYLSPDVHGDEAARVTTDGAPAAGANLLYMPRALVVPGALHICSNLCKDITGRMSHWQTFVKQLQLFVELLANKDRRERFVQTCIGHRSEDGRRFRDFSGSLYEKRWGAVAAFVDKLQPLLPSLRRHWDAEAYAAGFTARDRGDDQGVKFAPSELSEALGCSLFNAYLWMVQFIFSSVENLTGWFEGCACHEHLLKSTHARHARRALAREIGVAEADCPMKGKRAPELAAGALDATFDALWGGARDSLLEKCAELGATDEQQAVLLNDFEAGRSFLQLGLQVKLDFWTRLPWKLAALGHFDVGVARRVAADCVQAFDEFRGEDPTHVHHCLSIMFLAAGGPLRAQVPTGRVRLRSF